MANTKISNLTALTNATTATNDQLVIVDTSATETKKIAISEIDLRYAALSHTQDSTTITDFTEAAQDAIGAMVDATIDYVDGTPSLGRAAISGDITIASGSNTAAIGTGVIVDADINASAAIDASKIADGSVSNTEFQYINSLTSNAQTQINAKLTSPLTTKGDLHTFSTVDDRLAVGTDGQILMADSAEATGIKWAAAPSGYSDEQAQDAIGAMIDASLVYVDGTPLLTRAALTGDVTASQGSNATTIANSAVTNAKMADMATLTIKGNSTGGSAAPSDLSVTTVTSMLNNFVGDSGSGGTKGLVPAPGAGDAAALKFLKADGTWATTPSSPTGAALTKSDDTNVTLTLGGSPTTALLAATSLTLGWTGSLSVSRGGTGLGSYTTGDIVYASGSTTLAGLAAVATGSVLVSAGSGTAPVYSTTPQITRLGIGVAAGATTELTITQPVRTTGSPTGFLYTGGAHTTLTASTEAIDVDYALNRTVQFSTGALTTQRAMYFRAPTYAFVGASTITNAYTLEVDQPVAGTNATITNPFALWCNGRLKVGSGTTGFIVRDNTSSSTFCAFYNTNVTPSNTNHTLSFNGGTTILNATSSGNLQLAIDATTVLTVAANTVTITGSVAGSVLTVTNSSTSAAVAGATISMATSGYNAGQGVLVLTSTTATTSTTQNYINLTKSNINADTTQEHNISWSLRDNSASREAGKIGLRYTDTGSGTQKTRFYFRTLIGGTTLTETQNFTGYNAFFGGSTTPTALVHMAAGTATASTAPLKFTSGTNLTTAENGAMEYNGTNLFFTRTGATRESVFVGVSGATAPATTAGVVITNFYGSAATNFLGDPNSWASVVIAGTTYKVPLYT